MVPVLSGDNWNNSLIVEGFEAGPDTNTNASFNAVGPGYFKTMGIPLMMPGASSRAPTPSAGTPKVAVVNQAFAARSSTSATENRARQARSALGGPNAKPDIEIVGMWCRTPSTAT